MTGQHQPDGDGLDLCECGDYRHQHHANGHCKFNKPNGLGHGGGPDCIKFRLTRPASTRDGAEGAGDISRCIETIEKSYAFADGNIPLQKCGEWIYLKELVLAAPPKPVLPADGTGEHGIQCDLCGETLHDNEICDDTECPIGGNFTVHPSPAVAAEPERACTCHPDDNPPIPCTKRYALSECKAWDAALWALVSTLHSNIDEEDKRPHGWSDFSDGQIERLNQAANAFLRVLSCQAPRFSSEEKS